MDYDGLIRNWHTKASEEDYFSKFVFEYLAFIGFLRKKKFKYEKDDRGTIQKLKQDNKTKTAYLKRIQNSEELETAWEHIKEQFDREPFHDAARLSIHRGEHKWWNCSHLKSHQQTEEEKRKRKGIIHSLEDWENMVEFWYCVRNNLFHGEKDPEHQRDEFAVEFGYKTLRELVELLLAEVQQ
jgi:hypothetical protein